MLLRLVPTSLLYLHALFDLTDGEPINAAAIELCRRLGETP